MVCVLNETGIAYPSLAPGFTPDFCFEPDCSYVLVFCAIQLIHDVKVIYLIHDSKYKHL
jgi:hypothetical protein